MQSIRSKLFIWLIRKRHLFKMKLKAEVVDSSFSVAKFRKDVDKITAKMKIPKGVITKHQRIADFNAEWVVPEQSTEG
jgi:hypothetical protein